MRNLENFEEHSDFDVCERGMQFFDTNCVQKVESISGDEWTGRMRQGRRSYHVQVCFDESSGEIFEPFSFCGCGIGNCEHQVALLFEVRKFYLGAQSDSEPLFRQKECPGLGSAALRYADSGAFDAFAAAKRVMRQTEPLDIALGFSSYMKMAIRQKRRLNNFDIAAETGVMAISALGDEALENGDLKLASKLQSIAADTLDAIQNLAWRNKGLAAKERTAVFAKLAALAAADPAIAKETASNLSLVVAKAKHEDTILCSAKIAELAKRDKKVYEMFSKSLSWRSIPFESAGIKRARRIFEAFRLDSKDELLNDLINTKTDDDRLFGYVDFLAAKGDIEKALDICEKRRKLLFKKGRSLNWDEKQCQIFEQAGNIKGIQEIRELVAFEEKIKDDDYFRNYDKMKAAYAGKDWKKIEEKMIQSMKGDTPGSYGARYIKHLVREGKTEELYQICASDPIHLGEAYEALLPVYGDKLNDLFGDYIFALARSSTKPIVYKLICEQLLACGKRGVDAAKIRRELVERYPNRRQFKEALEDLILA
jgi:hypothetical protein